MEIKSKTWICFLDEKNQKIEIFVDLDSVDSSFVRFKTKEGNLIRIPSHRVLKIKEREILK